MTLVLTIFVVVAVLVLALALAWLPMRLLLGQITRNLSQFIQRQRERRQAGRETPERRKAPQTR